MALPAPALAPQPMVASKGVGALGRAQRGLRLCIKELAKKICAISFMHILKGLRSRVVVVL